MKMYIYVYIQYFDLRSGPLFIIYTCAAAAKGMISVLASAHQSTEKCLIHHHDMMQ